ncbi:hypothetical protein LCGC14_1037730 [marine sediment metagenome]|uniref:Uncharacterized protein n=1 Tax=marine sediment metagenome TaxID=412755 RepID=A0A0F9MSS1_9ZZZZ
MQTKNAYIESVKNLKHSQIKSLEQKIEWLDETCKDIKACKNPEFIIQQIRITQKSLMSLIDTLKEETTVIVNAYT